VLYADALPKLASAGVQIPAKWVNSKLKIPEPEGDEPVLRSASSAPTDAKPAKTESLNALAANTKAENTDDRDPTPVSAMTDLLARDSAPSIKAWVALLSEKAEKAESLEALRDDLLASYAVLESDELTKVMAMAFAAAELSGRFDVSQGG
jgi:phage gp29-like protein